jgi:hypothetical protein
MSSASRFNPDGDGAASHEIDFLDTIVQGLFGLGLKLEYCIALVEDSPEQAKLGLDAAVSAVGELIEPIREEIQRLGGSRNLSTVSEHRSEG